MHRFESLVLALVVFLSAPSGARGGITFVGPLTILNVPRPVTVHAGDFDNDGKKDLIVSNGTDTVFVLFQNSTNRAEWQSVPLRVGSSTFFTRAGDFDGDGFDDLLAGDNASAAYLVRSNGDRTFAQPQPIVAARGPRWVATGDWDRDGNLDFASSNLSTATLTIFLGDGAGGFNLSQEVGGAREHTLEGLDYDGDGKLDLALGTGLPGIILYKGAGNGTFRVGGNVPNLGCIEYIATGDFNNDGKSDLATTCIDDQNAYAGISVGNGTYKQTLKTPFASGTESAAIADLDGDGIQDLALVSNGSSSLRIYLGNGDGTFQPPVDYGPTGSKPVFLIAQDLDGDGHKDVISADTDSSTLTVFFGTEGDRLFEAADLVSGYSGIRGFGVADFDRDGVPDFFYAMALASKIQIYLKPGGRTPTAPSLTVTVANKYNSLDVGDLDGDGIPDVAGSNFTAGTALVALLSPGGTAHDELALQAGMFPGRVKIARINEDIIPDLAVACAGPSYIAIFLGTGGGKFADLRTVPTTDSPKDVTVGDVDKDGKADLVVVSPKKVVVHYGLGGGSFSDFVPVAQDPVKSYTEAAIADMQRDGIPDLLVAETTTQGVLYFKGRGNRAFAQPVLVKMGSAPTGLSIVDVDGDGILDITTSSAPDQQVSVAFGRATGTFSPTVSYRAGVTVVFHRFVDVDLDGVKDLASVGATSTAIRLGRLDPPPPPRTRFRRGDANSDAELDFADPIFVLLYLFAGHAPGSCLSSMDANDDGKVDLADALSLLFFSVLGQFPPLEPLGACGIDPTLDGLGCDSYPPCG